MSVPTDILKKHPDVLTDPVGAGNRASPPRCPNDAPLALARGKRVTTPLYKGAFMANSNQPQPVYDHDYDDALTFVNSALAFFKNPPITEIPRKMIGPLVVGSYDMWWRSKQMRNEFVVVHAQQYWVHDMSEMKPRDGLWDVTCTCGLVVSMPDDAAKPLSSHVQTKYFSGNRRNSIDWQHQFFSAPGHRDPFHDTVLGAFLICVSEPTPEDSRRLELQCAHCGWIESTTLDPDWDAFVTFGHRMWIDIHNAYCPGDGVEVLDEDVFLFGHNPLGAWKAARAKQLRLEADRAGDEDTPAE